jgi:hypothetical protein
MWRFIPVNPTAFRSTHQTNECQADALNLRGVTTRDPADAYPFDGTRATCLRLGGGAPTPASWSTNEQTPVSGRLWRRRGERRRYPAVAGQTLPQYGQVNAVAGRLWAAPQNSHPQAAWRSRSGERIVIRRPVASFTASICVLARDHLDAGTSRISVIRTTCTLPETFAVYRPPTWISLSFKGHLR